MLKNKFKIITLLLVIILAISVPIVRAEDENNAQTQGNESAPISTETPTAENSTTTNNVTDDNFKKSDVYLTGDSVTIDYIIDGNLFVFANNVTINSQIGGDAFIYANSVTIGEQGYVFSNLFTTCSTLDIKGVVYDIYALSKDVTISGYVYRDVRANCSNLNIFGTIGRNAFVNCSSIAFTQNTNSQQTDENSETYSQGIINGNLTYSSNNEVSIPEGSVTGETNYTKSSQTTNTLQYNLMSLGTLLATAILVWLLLLWLSPKFLKNTNNLLTKKPLPVIGLGIITPIVLVLVSILLLLLGITAPFALLVFALLCILIGISTSIFIITLNNILCNILKIQKTIGIFGMLIVTTIILWLVGLIPYVGLGLGIIGIVIGLGILVSGILLKDKKTEKNKDI